MAELKTNLLYFGDNLEWLSNVGRFPDESVDLVYLDPPFNSNRSYNVLFKESDVRDSEAQIHAFEDTWSWDKDGRVQAVFNDFWMKAPEKPKQMLKALIEALGHNDVTAYLVMMAPRLVELHRIMKPTGSLYLHCDPTASHYLKIMLDSVFGPGRFRNEIIWKRTTAHSSAKRWAPIHDTILYYGRGAEVTWADPRGEYEEEYLDKYYKFDDGDGRLYWRADLCAAGVRKGRSGLPWRGIDPGQKGMHWKFTVDRLDELDAEGRIYWPKNGVMPQYKRYREELKGKSLSDIWDDVDRINPVGRERLGYPTQKPLALLERIIGASSNPGDVVLDPFCGCGTAVHAAQKLGRRWIGIDITPLATNLIRERMEDAFPGLKVPIEGWPADYAGAAALAEMTDKYHFQDWAVIQAGARPAGGERKKGADKGIDGVIPFIDGSAGPKRGIVSVKAGNTGPTHIRDLAGVVSGDTEAAFGVFICLKEPTKPMVDAALDGGTWVSEYDGQTYPRIQIMSAQDLIDGRLPKMPQGARTSVFAQAQRERRREGEQGRLT